MASERCSLVQLARRVDGLGLGVRARRPSAVPGGDRCSSSPAPFWGPLAVDLD